MSLQTGQILDKKYRIIRELGSGSMGAVYEGENLLIKRRVAIKVLLPEVAKRGDAAKRFENEAQAAGRIGSDHIVEVLDMGGLDDGGCYMVMEFLEGETLGARIKRRGRVDPRELAPIIQQLLMGLEMAHDAQIIHRDLKPENIFLLAEHAGQADFVKILDFGVSKFNPLTDGDAMSMTRTGTVVGTPFYMSPEQAKGARDIDGRSDLYSVGVILYEAVTGQVPFHAGTFNELIFKIVLEAPPPPEKLAPDTDSGFSRIIKRAMAREVHDRYQAAAEFRDALYVWLHTGRESLEQTHLREPPIGSDVDWDGEKGTLLMNGDDPSNLETQLIDGGGTQLMVPDDSPNHGTHIMDPVPTTKPAGTPLATESPSKRPPPVAQRRNVPPTAPLPAVSPPATHVATMASHGSAHGQATTPPGNPPIGPSSATPVGPGAAPASFPIEDWPTGVPKKRSPVVPIAMASIVAIGIFTAAVLLVPQWMTDADTGAPSTTPVAQEDETSANGADVRGEDTRPDVTQASTATSADSDDPPAGAAGSDDGEPTNPAPQPGVAQQPTPTPAAPPPSPRTFPHPYPRTSPRPSPVPASTPPPRPPPPPPTGRKVETEL